MPIQPASSISIERPRSTATTTWARFAPPGATPSAKPGRLSLDEVRQHLALSVLPRLAADGVIAPAAPGLTPWTLVRFSEKVWREIASARDERRLGVPGDGRAQRREGCRRARRTGVRPQRRNVVAGGSVLEAKGLVKKYRRRPVVNDVALRLQQGEIVGLLGPNGAGKTTTFYMIVGLIEPLAGHISVGRR